jgi:hypothetical protein
MNDKLRELVEAAFREGFLVGEANQASCDIGDIAILLNKAWLQSETRDVLFATALEAEPDGWQPIETASRLIPIGDRVLVYGRLPESWGYSPEEWLVSVGTRCIDGYSSQASTINRNLVPTHWMPLPAPPKGLRNES